MIELIPGVDEEPRSLRHEVLLLRVPLPCQCHWTDVLHRQVGISTHLESIVIISIIKVPWLHLHDIWL